MSNSTQTNDTISTMNKGLRIYCCFVEVDGVFHPRQWCGDYNYTKDRAQQIAKRYRKIRKYDPTIGKVLVRQLDRIRLLNGVGIPGLNACEYVERQLNAKNSEEN